MILRDLVTTGIGLTIIFIIGSPFYTAGFVFNGPGHSFHTGIPSLEAEVAKHQAQYTEQAPAMLAMTTFALALVVVQMTLLAASKVATYIYMLTGIDFLLLTKSLELVSMLFSLVFALPGLVFFAGYVLWCLRYFTGSWGDLASTVMPLQIRMVELMQKVSSNALSTIINSAFGIRL